MAMRMSVLESDLKSRIEEEIREIAERRASEIIEDHLAKTAESPCAKPPVRAIAPTLIEDEIIEAVKASPVHSVPPVRAPYSAPPPPYSAPPPAYSQPPPRSSYGPPSSHPSMPPASMHPASMAPVSMFPHSTPNYIVWPDVADPSLRAAAVAATPHRGNTLLMAIAALALALSGAAFATSTGPLGSTSASAAPVTKPLVHPLDTTTGSATTGSAPPIEETTFAAPAPTLNKAYAPPAGNDAPRWSRRYKGADAQLAPKADVKAADKAAKTADSPPSIATEPAPPAPKMEQASKTAEMLREQLKSSVK